MFIRNEENGSLSNTNLSIQYILFLLSAFLWNEDLSRLRVIGVEREEGSNMLSLLKPLSVKFLV